MPPTSDLSHDEILSTYITTDSKGHYNNLAWLRCTTQTKDLHQSFLQGCNTKL